MDGKLIPMNVYLCATKNFYVLLNSKKFFTHLLKLVLASNLKINLCSKNGLISSSEKFPLTFAQNTTIELQKKWKTECEWILFIKY